MTRVVRASLILVAAVSLAAATIYLTRDPGETPRAQMHAEVTPPSVSETAPLAVPASTNDSPRVATAPDAPAPNIAAALTDLERALAASDPDRYDLVLAEKLPALIAADPAAAARYAELQTEPRLRELLVRQVAQLWAARDADDAIAWAESLPDSPERQATLIDVSLIVARGDPARAVQWREQSVGNQVADGVLEGLVQQWADRDFDAAIAWTGARPRNAQRDQVLQRLVYVRAAMGEPEAAARLADEAFADPAKKAEAVATIAHQWALRDLEAATRWAESLEPRLGTRAVQEIAAVHAVQNPPN